jgi:hypothetical protein
MALPPVLVPSLKNHDASGAISATVITRNFGVAITTMATTSTQNHHCFQIGLPIFEFPFQSRIALLKMKSPARCISITYLDTVIVPHIVPTQGASFLMSGFFERWQEEARRQRELEHEQKLADIRTQSRALIWAGTEEELVEEITKCYRAGLLRADDLPDALQKAAIHFVRPDGKPIIKPANILPPETSSRFRPMDERYQSIEFDGRQYELTPTQAIIVRILHKAHLEKRARVGVHEIYKALSVNSGKMSGWFRDKKNKSLYGKLIVQSAGRHHYRLDL